MAAVARPVEEMPRPNIASANIQLPAVRRLRAGRREIIATLRPTVAWFIGLGIAIIALLIGDRRLDLPDLQGARRRRLQPAGDVGRVHHHLRVLGRHRSRGHADLGHSVSVPRRVPHDDLPLRRGDDGVRRHDGGAVPDSPPRPAVEVLLADPVPELAAHLAELQEPAGVGRVRDPHVPHRLDDVPLRRPHPRHRGAARPARRIPIRKRILRRALARLAEHRSRVAALRARVPVPRRVLARRSCSRCTPSCRSTSRWRSRRDGTRRSSRRTSSPARSSPASGWCSRSSSRSGSGSISSTTSRSTTSTPPRSCASSRRSSSASRT